MFPPPPPWKQIGDIDPEREYLGFTSRILRQICTHSARFLCAEPEDQEAGERSTRRSRMVIGGRSSEARVLYALGLGGRVQTARFRRGHASPRCIQQVRREHARKEPLGFLPRTWERPSLEMEGRHRDAGRSKEFSRLTEGVPSRCAVDVTCPAFWGRERFPSGVIALVKFDSGGIRDYGKVDAPISSTSPESTSLTIKDLPFGPTAVFRGNPPALT